MNTFLKLIAGGIIGLIFVKIGIEIFDKKNVAAAIVVAVIILAAALIYISH